MLRTTIKSATSVATVQSFVVAHTTIKLIKLPTYYPYRCQLKKKKIKDCAILSVLFVASVPFIYQPIRRTIYSRTICCPCHSYHRCLCQRQFICYHPYNFSNQKIIKSVQPPNKWKTVQSRLYYSTRASVRSSEFKERVIK